MDRQKLDDILGGVPLPMVLIGADDRIFAVNPAAAAILDTAQIDLHHAIALRQPALLSVIEAARLDGRRGHARYVVHGALLHGPYRIC